MSKLKPEFSRKGFFNKAIGRIKRIIRNEKRAKIRKEVFEKIKPFPCPEKADCEISYLLCSKDFEMGVISAYSLLKFGKQAIKLRFFEDGTLTPDQWSRLKRHFPGHDFLLRKEVDALIIPHFGANSNLVKARNQNPLFHKLIDIPFLSKTERVTFSDPDILYLDHPEEFLDVASGNSAISFFNRDMASSYFYPTEELNPMLGRAIPEEINSGLWSIPVKALNFTRLEQLLGEKPFSDFWKSWRIEQTLFAFLTSENDQQVKCLSESYDVGYHKEVSSSPCKHYVGYIRHGFELEGLKYLLKSGKI